jgi:1-acyl-sn-glycerol-3-phosphate acyltransferase
VSKPKGEYPSPIVIRFLRGFIGLISRIFWRIEFKNTENIPQNFKGGLLITPNHQTYADPFWITIPIKRKMRYMAWDEAFDWFIVGRVIKYLGAFPVNLERGSKSSFIKAIKILREGETLIIFPEGARELTDGKMLPFKQGAFKIAQKAGVPIMPVTIRGANKVWGRGINVPRMGKVEIIYHPILEIPNSKDKNEAAKIVEETTEKVRRIIENSL